MARLRGPVDAFFEKVTVNDKDAGLRKNRLLLLSRLRAVLHTVAEFLEDRGVSFLPRCCGGGGTP